MKKSQSHANSRIGERSYNSNGTSMEIIRYNGCEDITVLFEDGYEHKTTYGNFKKGKVRNYYDRTVYNVGYIGVGEHKNQTLVYYCWHNMIKRCYNEEYKKSHPGYDGCTVDDFWHNFQNFATWWEDNYYEVGDEVMTLDKDILVKGNRIYSPETCLIVPMRVNSLFIKSPNTTSNLPIGVIYSNRTGIHGGKRYIGAFTSPYNRKKKQNKAFHTIEDAFVFYKTHKDIIIKEVAEEYKGKVPRQVYDALLKYEVEITDLN